MQPFIHIAKYLLPRSIHHADPVWKDDRDLSVYIPCSDSVCHIDQPGMGTDWNQLSEKFICTCFSGISDDGMCGNLCGIARRAADDHRTSCGTVGRHGIYRYLMLQPV